MGARKYRVWEVKTGSADTVKLYFVSDVTDTELTAKVNRPRAAEFLVSAQQSAEVARSLAVQVSHVLNGFKEFTLTESGQRWLQLERDEVVTGTERQTAAAETYAAAVIKRVSARSKEQVPPAGLKRFFWRG